MISCKVKYIHYIGNYAIIGMFDNSAYLINSTQIKIIKAMMLYNDEDEIINYILKSLDINASDFSQAKYIIQKYFEKLENIGIYAPNDTDYDFNHISITGVEGKYYPYRLTFELTNDCIAKCSHCFKKANEGMSQYLDFSKIVELDKELRGNYQIVHLTGGEPLLHPDFEKIVLFFKHKNIELNTNGILIKKYNPLLFKSINALCIGVYGLSDEEYFQNTGIVNGFSSLCKSCQLLKENHVNFSLSLVINKHNLNYLQQYIELAYNLGADEFVPGLASQIGRLEYVDEYNSYWILSAEEKKLAYLKLRQLGIKYYGKIKIDDWSREVYRSPIMRESEKVYKNRSFPCGAGTMKWTVTEDFFFKPCTMFLDCSNMYLTYSEWKDYISGKEEIVWSKYREQFVALCEARGTDPSEYCDYMPKRGEHYDENAGK